MSVGDHAGGKGDVHKDAVQPRSRARVPVQFDDAYLPLNELATYSGVSRRTLEKYLADPVHSLPYYRFGTQVAVKRSEFDEWARLYHRVAPDMLDVKALVDAEITGVRHSRSVRLRRHDQEHAEDVDRPTPRRATDPSDAA
jgi:excisionase family DNA binding protein